MMRLNFLCPHEHNVSNVKQINPIVLPLPFQILSNTKLVPLRLLIKVGFLLHPIDLFGRQERHLQLLHHVSWDLLLWLGALAQLVLEDDIYKLLLVLFKLNQHLFNIGLMHIFRLEFISYIVTCLCVVLLLTVLILTNIRKILLYFIQILEFLIRLFLIGINQLHRHGYLYLLVGVIRSYTRNTWDLWHVIRIANYIFRAQKFQGIWRRSLPFSFFRFVHL